jgi:oligosaccharide repeat unit polymerase
MQIRSTNPFLATPPWWQQPYMNVLVWLIPLLVVAWLVPVEFHWQFRRPTKFIDFNLFLVGLAGALAIVVGAYLSSRLPTRSPTVALQHLVDDKVFLQTLIAASWLFFAVTVFAYVYWFRDLASNPSLLIDSLTGARRRYNLRDVIDTVPGITTLTQVGVVYVTLFMIRLLYIPKSRPGLIEKGAFALIIVLALVRNFAWSERLGLLEIMIPVGVLMFRTPKNPRFAALMPVFAVSGLFIFFAFFEYFRSWSGFYQYREESFWMFAISRLAGYYVTALDNGAGWFQTAGSFSAPIYTIDWLWYFPFDLGQSELLKSIGFNIQNYRVWLDWFANIELNNASGIYVVFVDYGVIGGIIFWFLYGLVTGLLYRAYVKGSLFGLLIYPSWFTTLMELPRIRYYSSSRYFPAMIIMLTFLLILYLIFAYRRNRFRLAGATG